MTDLRVILLDSYNQHPPNQSNLGPRIQHFTDRNTCIGYIRNEMERCTQIDLFVSSAETDIIGTNLPLFRNIYFHIYCSTSDDIRTCESSFPYRAYVDSFEKDYLWVQISHMILAHDNLRVRVSNYSNQAFTAWQNTYSILLEEVQAAKLGVQPD